MVELANTSLALAGDAVITLLSGRTGNRYTFRIQKAGDKEMWFVGLLTGPDNTSDYKYIGIYTRRNGFRTTGRSVLSMSSTPCRAIEFFFRRMQNPPPELKIYHEGRCCRCGRPLTTPESIEAGLGPECRRRVG